MTLLSSADTLSRLDGYQTINGALKASNDLANDSVLRDRSQQLQGFILRDLKPTTTDTRNTNITTQALKLTATLFQFPSLSSGLTNDFRSHLLDMAIGVLKSESSTLR